MVKIAILLERGKLSRISDLEISRYVDFYEFI